MASILQHIAPLARHWHLPTRAGVQERLRRWRLAHALHAMRKRRYFRLDIAETDDAYQVEAEMPGYDKQALRVEIDGNAVLIYAEGGMQDDAAARVAREPQYRYFSLPQAIDERTATAHYRHGMLELTLPKKTDGRGKYLAIR